MIEFKKKMDKKYKTSLIKHFNIYKWDKLLNYFNLITLNNNIMLIEVEDIEKKQNLLN